MVDSRHSNGVLPIEVVTKYFSRYSKQTIKLKEHNNDKQYAIRGIHPNDILVVDRSLEAISGKIVICALNGELTVKRLDRNNEQWQLKAENPFYPDIVIHEELEMVIWGVVTNVIHPL